jgi:hypothetical protein
MATKYRTLTLFMKVNYVLLFSGYFVSIYDIDLKIWNAVYYIKGIFYD